MFVFKAVPDRKIKHFIIAQCTRMATYSTAGIKGILARVL